MFTGLISDGVIRSLFLDLEREIRVPDGLEFFCTLFVSDLETLHCLLAIILSIESRKSVLDRSIAVLCGLIPFPAGVNS